MKLHFEKSYLKWGITAFLVVACSIIFFFMIYRHTGLTRGMNTFAKVLRPFVYGLVMAYLLCPLYNACVRLFGKISWPGERLQQHNLSIARGFASVISLVALLGIIFGIFMLIIPQMAESVVSILKIMPKSIQQFTDWIQTRVGAHSNKIAWLYTWINDATGGISKWVHGKLFPLYKSIFSGVGEVGLSIVGGVKDFFIGLVICIFFINSKELFAAQSKKLILAILKEEHADNFLRGAAFVNKTFGGFINGKLLDSLIIGVICFICMSIFGWPYAVLISVIVGVTNIIPFFGPFIGAIPSVLLLLMKEPTTALYFLIFVLVLQQVDGNIIGPKILGDSTGLSSFWVMFAILVGGGLFGFLGMIVGIPVFTVIYAYVCFAVNKRLEGKGLSTNTKDYYSLYKYGKDVTLVNEHTKEN